MFLMLGPSLKRPAVLLAGLIVFAGCATAAAAAKDRAESGGTFLMDYVVGSYAVVGQAPDSTTAYSGVATIARKGDGLVLTRKIGGKSTTFEGRVEVPSPPGEGSVLRFRWVDRVPHLMTCMAHGDLDNYPRLTCVWGTVGTEPEQPGIEALFPTATWPDKASGKQLQPKQHSGKVVELFSVSWCSWCKKAREYFVSQGVSLTEYDIEKDAAAMARKNDLDSQPGVPFAIVNGFSVHGYSEEAFSRALHSPPPESPPK